jgi:transcription antitermination factor NusG
MSKEKSPAKKISKGSSVKITDGEHDGKLGKVTHLRAATGEAHVELESGKVVNVPASTLVAA